jgi:hypothetical protein
VDRATKMSPFSFISSDPVVATFNFLKLQFVIELLPIVISVRKFPGQINPNQLSLYFNILKLAPNIREIRLRIDACQAKK